MAKQESSISVEALRPVLKRMEDLLADLNAFEKNSLGLGRRLGIDLGPLGGRTGACGVAGGGTMFDDLVRYLDEMEGALARSRRYVGAIRDKV